jgi:hypothetical protein
MPDGAKLMAAVLLGALGFILSDMIKALMDEDINFGYFSYVNVLLGVVVGWSLVGRRAGRGVTFAINNGFTGVIAMVMLGLFVQGSNEMLRLAMRNRYDSAFEAIISIVEHMMEYALVMSTVPIAVVVVLGGIIAGLCTEVAWHRWR